jgi:hypothetical protein
MAFPSHANPIETRIIAKLIRRALKKDWVISVNDGEEWALVRSKDFEAITAEVHATEETYLHFRDAEGTKLGWVWLIHGNDEDVVSDHVDNDAMADLVKDL